MIPIILSNPEPQAQLHRRFNGILHIDDYTPEELLQILNLNLNRRKELDMALLKLEGSNFPQMPILSRNEMSRVGDDVALAGYPFGAKLSDSESELNYSIFEGKIASTQVQRGYDKQFVDMQAKRGNSGGPVIDRETGLVVGVLCGSQTEGDSRLVEEINYIRPIKYVWEVFTERKN